MKEFTSSFGVNFGNGLRPDDRAPKNLQYLTQCQNARVVKFGEVPNLVTYTPPTDPFATGYLAGLTPAITVSHGTPCAFKGRETTFVLTKTGIYTATEGANWTLSQLSTYNAYAVKTVKTITSGSVWHFADFGDAYAFFNGVNTVFKTNRLSMFGDTSTMLVEDDITVQTGCAFNGRMIMGGFSSSDFWNDEWENFVRDIHDTGFGIAFPTALDTNWVWWSQIGSDAFWLFYPSDSLRGLITDDSNDVYTDDKNRLMEMVQRNEMGFMPMHWQGTVNRVLPLGGGVMVYGTGGISYMPKSANTFGLQEVLPIGTASRSAAFGNIKEHVFIDDAGWLWKASAANPTNPKRLGFREYFETALLAGRDIMINYDQIEDEYYISDGYTCYVLAGEQLYESTYLVNSLTVSMGATYGIYHRPGDADDAYSILCTDVIDMGLRSIKTIERVVVSATNTTTIYVAIDWRMKSSDAWSRTTFRLCNYEGVAYFPITGVEFRVVVRVTDYTKLDVDDVDIQFKTTDKRIIRGAYAIKGSTGAGE